MILLGAALACDPEPLWGAFREAVLAGPVPELPLADLGAVADTTRALARCAPRSWQAEVAAAELDLLRGDPTRAEARLAALACAEADACAVYVAPLRYAVHADLYSSLGHGWLAATVTDRAPEMLLGSPRAAAAYLAAVGAPAPARGLTDAWVAAADLRNARATVRTAWFSPKHVEFTVAVGASFGRRWGAPGAVLAWTLDPRASEAPADAAGADFLHELAAVFGPAAPEEGGVLWQGLPPDTAVWRSRGRESPALAALGLGRSVPRNAPPRSRGEVLARLAAAELALRAGDPVGARRALRAADALCEALGIRDLRASIALFRLRVALSAGDGPSAVAELDRALEAAGPAPGRVDSVLAVSVAAAEAAFVLEDQPVAADVLLRAVMDRGRHAGSVAILADRVQVAADLADSAGLLGEAIRRYRLALTTLAALEERVRLQRVALTGRVPDRQRDLLTHPGRVSQRRALVHQALATALEGAGAPWAAVQAQLDAARAQWSLGAGMPEDVLRALRGEAVRSADPGPMLGLIDELQGSLWLAHREKQGDPEALRRGAVDDAQRQLLDAAEGDGAALAALKAEVDVLARQTATLPPGSAGHALALQFLAGRRELWLLLAPRAAPVAEARAVYEAWLADPLSGSDARRYPGAEAGFAGLAAWAAGDLAAARDHFEAAITWHRAPEHARILRLRDREADAWGGAVELSLADAPLAAMGFLDELRVRQASRRAGRAPPPPLALPERWEGGAALSVAYLKAPGRLVAWLLDEQGVEHVVIPVEADEPALATAVLLAADGVRTSPALQRLGDWVAARLPPEKPLWLVIDPRSREAGAHALPVGGLPLAARNPLVEAPSLADALRARASPALHGRLHVLAMPLDPAADAELAPVLREPELAALAGGRLWWDTAASRDRARSLLRTAPLLHVSTHGRLDRLDPAGSGLLLADGVLGVDDLAELRPGIRVVLSACGSGIAAGGTASLDLALLYGGARSVVSTPYATVDATVAAAWMTTFHAEVREGASFPVAAWRASRARYAPGVPPAVWAPFVVLGA